MRNRLIVFFIVINSIFYSQKVSLLNFQKEFIVWDMKPSTKQIKEKYGYDMEIDYEKYHFNFCYRKAKFSWLIGLSFMKINSTIKDRINNWNYVGKAIGATGIIYYDTVYINYSDPPDLRSSSTNLGIHNEIIYHFKPFDKKQNLNHAIGLKSEVYLYEKFESEYYTTDIPVKSIYDPAPGYSDQPFPLFFEHNTLVYISNANLSTFYQIRWFPHDAFSIGMRISAGTNLYSDWQQFKKFGWLSLGLEVGFLAKKPKVSHEN